MLLFRDLRVFWRCIQCIKILLLSYLNQHYNTFSNFGDFEVVKSYTEWTKWLIYFFNQKDWTKWNRKMGGRSFIVTSGAFKDTLLYARPFKWLRSCAHGQFPFVGQWEAMKKIQLEGTYTNMDMLILWLTWPRGLSQ